MRFNTGALKYCLALLLSALALSSTQAGLLSDDSAWERWRPAAAEPSITVDHSAWAALLRSYLIDQDPTGINRFDYAGVTAADRQRLDAYIAALAVVPVARLTPLQQQAYWINLYNALTVQVILANPGVGSIREIKSGWFSLGPWDLELVEVDAVPLTLNDIEHRILRPIYGDARVHFAVNCASLGCPNLIAEPFLADTLDRQLDAATRAFINHPRGASISDNKLMLSSIFKWYADDFGRNTAERLDWIANYANSGLALELRGYDGRISYEYDWQLNAPVQGESP